MVHTTSFQLCKGWGHYVFISVLDEKKIQNLLRVNGKNIFKKNKHWTYFWKSNESDKKTLDKFMQKLLRAMK